MPRPRELLQRFRFAGTPGAAAGGGVPVDRAAEAADELTPVLALLDEAQQQTGDIRAEGAAQAARTVDDAHEEARRRVDAARQEAGQVRATAARDIVLRSARQSAGVQRDAETEAAAIRARAHRRMPDLVDRVVAAVWSVPPTGPATGPATGPPTGQPHGPSTGSAPEAGP